MRNRISLSKGFFPLLFSSLIMVLCLAGCAQDSSILDNGQSRQLEFSVTTRGWNNSNSSPSDSKKDSRATPISGNTFDTSKSFNMIADQNDGSGNYSTLIDKESVSYSNNIWKTTKDYYWSGNSSKTINFYAYYPTSISSSISHTAGSAPTLSYTVPDDVANQPDIIVASKDNVAGNTTASTDLTFNHILAAVQFSVGSSGLPSGTISSITISGIKNSGNYTFGSGWTLNSDTKTFTISPSMAINGTSGESITTGTYTLMMIPQIFSNAVITLIYSNGTTFSTTISGTWKAGNVYTYQLSKSVVYNFDYTGNVQTFTVPYTGTYKLEVWGAQGGSGGYGGYSYGNIKLNQNAILYIYIGGYEVFKTFKSVYGAYNTYNGGGIGDAAGGGATHISTTNRGELKNYAPYQDEVIIVAGGGGGLEWAGKGGDGGGQTGSNGSSTGSVSATGGSQISGGVSTAYLNETATIVNGSFGQGGYGYNSNTDYGAGGGGGWYGGGGTSYSGAGGGGSGHLGSSLVSGTTGMRNGIRSGDGYARITFISAN